MYVLVALLAAAQPAPVLQCPTPVVTRGDVKAGAPLVHTFDLAHRGAAGKLTITKVEAGCGCVRRGLSAEALARLGVEAACEFDEYTGAPIQSFTVKLK